MNDDTIQCFLAYVPYLRVAPSLITRKPWLQGNFYHEKKAKHVFMNLGPLG